MKKTNWMQTAALGLALAMGISVMAGCGQTANAEGVSYTPGGVITISVNPEVAVLYDGNGNVVQVEARNDDGQKIVDAYSGYQGREARQVVSEIVNEIGKAGYFASEVENETEDGVPERRITIEMEPGSSLPSDTFLEDVVADTRKQVEQAHWNGSVYVLDYDAEDYIRGEKVDYIDDDDIVVFYESTGKVTTVVSGDDNKIEKVYKEFTGSDVRETVLKLIDQVEAANYYVESIENEGHRIEIEIDPVSELNGEVSAKELNNTAREQVKTAQWIEDRLVIDYDAEDFLGIELDSDDDLDDDDDDDADDVDDDDDEDDIDDNDDADDVDDDDLDDDDHDDADDDMDDDDDLDDEDDDEDDEEDRT